jgi:hypothetical protein
MQIKYFELKLNFIVEYPSLKSNVKRIYSDYSSIQLFHFIQFSTNQISYLIIYLQKINLGFKL